VSELQNKITSSIYVTSYAKQGIEREEEELENGMEKCGHILMKLRIFLLCFLVVLEFELRALCVLGRCSTT
jgi:hypothetical protein